jgi:hypothetical protein
MGYIKMTRILIVKGETLISDINYLKGHIEVEIVSDGVSNRKPYPNVEHQRLLIIDLGPKEVYNIIEKSEDELIDEYEVIEIDDIN